MYKTRLQEICHQRLWSLPTYSSNRDGPDHCPRFTASVVVNGVSFDSSDFCKSSKEAQNEAAKFAFQHFSLNDSSNVSLPSSIPSLNASNRETVVVKNEESSNCTVYGNSSVVTDGQEIADVNYMYKSQLQNYAQKKSLSLPVYSCVREGTPHAPRYKATVNVDGRTFESPEFFRTLKEAEHAAARAALSSLSTNGIQEDDCGLYKNLLQDLAFKEGFSIPVYTTTNSGASHVPTFTSSVEVEGDIFHGIESKTKKQAELNAAKVAYISLKERQMSRIPAQSGVHEAFECIYPNSSSSQPNITADFQPELNLEASLNASNRETVVVKDEVSSNCTVYGNSSGVTDGREFADVNYIYKSQLQTYAQKKSLSLPVYSCVREGTPHAPRYKGTVNVDGRTFENPEFFRTLKEAEHAAARAALSSLSTNGIQEDDCALYKNLLQDLAKKEGFSIPVYTTTNSGASHVPTFTSSVEVEGDIFHGIESKTKKQAELNAAKVAYISLKERQMSRIPAQSEVHEGFECIYPNSSSSQSNFTADFQPELNLEGQSSRKPPSTEAHGGIEIIYPDSSSSNSIIMLNHKDKDEDGVDSSAQIITRTVEVKAEDHSTVSRNASGSSSQDGSSSPTTVLECLERAVTEHNANQKTKTECTWLCNRVLVYPRKQDLNLPKGVTMLPISDDQWVAVSVDYSDSSDS